MLFHGIRTSLFRFVCVVACMCLLAGRAIAHHSFASFDVNREITVEGTVKELQWANPHVWLQVLVFDKNKGGDPKEWGFETFGISVAKRAGWTSTSFKPGDKVTVEFNPFKDGKQGGRLLQVTLADGRVFSGYRTSQPSAE